MINLTLPFPPSSNRYWRNFRGVTVKSEEARAYQQAVRLMASQADMLEGELAVTVRLYRPRKSGDLDNRLKVVLDALQGVCYEDDKQISELHAYRRDDKSDPRVEIEIDCASEEGRI